jgi:hypothetical protein
MALSDACFEYLEAHGAAAAEFAKMIHHYSSPDDPLRYGAEIDALRRACSAVADAPYDPVAGSRLIELASSVMRFHDTPADASIAIKRMADMRRLIHILQDTLDADEAATVPALVQNVVATTGYTERAASRLKVLLAQIGKPTYDVAIKIIGDIGSAVAKKMLGL